MNDKEETETNAERVKRFADGAERIFVNAEALYKEAELLGSAGHFARATVLHQISMEECSKIDTLGAAAMDRIEFLPAALIQNTYQIDDRIGAIDRRAH